MGELSGGECGLTIILVVDVVKDVPLLEQSDDLLCVLEPSFL